MFRKGQQIRFGINLSYINLATNERERIVHRVSNKAKILRVSKGLVYLSFIGGCNEAVMELSKLMNNEALILIGLSN